MYLDLTVFLFLLVLPFSFAIVRFRRAQLPREVKKKYSAQIRWQSVTPFMKRWESKIDPCDLDIFRRYRRTLLLANVVLFGSPLACYFYLYLRYIYLFDRALNR